MIFFWFPINTDAPVYYFPWATLSLILANCLVYAAALAGLAPVDQWALSYAQINPLQWITSNFVHDGIGHLLGNMFFLWSVGLIVEGKLGWRMFLAVYFGIGMTQCAIEQVCMLGSEGGSLGASSIVFGLTAIALVWAPRNEISFSYVVWFLFFVRIGVIDVTVMTYAIFVTATELIVFTLQGFHVGTSALHLMGGALGYVVGVVLLRRGLVDCEGWDLFSVLRGTHGRIDGDPASVSPGLRGRARTSRRRRQRTPSRLLRDSSDEIPADAGTQPQGLSRTQRARRRIRQLLDSGKPRAAWTVLADQRHIEPTFRLESGPLRQLAAGMIEHRQWNEAVGLLEEYLERFDEQADSVRLQLAGLLAHKQRRPRAAQRVLEPIDPQRLSTKAQQRRDQLQRAIEEMIASGVIELSGQAFASE